MEIQGMRSLVVAALGFAMATAATVAQAPKQVQIFAGVLDGTGAPAASLEAGDVRVMEDGVAATVTKVERLDWPVKVQLLLDNGVGLGGGSMQPLKAGVQALLAALPENLEVTLVGTAPQPRFLARATTDRAALQQGIELLASERGAGRFVESLFEATQRIERDGADFFPIIISVATISGDRDMKEKDVERSWRGSRPAPRRCTWCSSPVVRREWGRPATCRVPPMLGPIRPGLGCRWRSTPAAPTRASTTPRGWRRSCRRSPGTWRQRSSASGTSSGSPPIGPPAPQAESARSPSASHRLS